LAALIALVFLAWGILQVPSVQTAIVSKAVSSIEKNLGGKVSFSRIHFIPFNAISIDDIIITDDNPYQAPPELGMPPRDTVLRAKNIFATMSIKGLFKRKGLHLGTVRIEDAYFVLAKEPGTSNLKRVFSAGDDSGKGGSPGLGDGDLLDAGRVEIKGLRFCLVNYGKAMKGYELHKFPRSHGIDFCNLDVTADLKARDIRIRDGYVTGKAEHLEAVEKSGYRIKSLSADAKVGHGVAEVTDIHLIDAYSDIRLPYYSMTGTIPEYSRFEPNIVLKGKIKDSKVAMKSISYFAPSLKDNPLVFEIAGADVTGPVAGLHVSGMLFRELTSGMHGLVATTISGLPKADDMVLDANITSLWFNASGAGKFMKGWTKKGGPDLSGLPYGGTLNFSGTGKGPINNLSIEGKLTSDAGGARARAYLRNVIRKGTPIEVGGRLYADDLNIGSMIGKEFIGECSARASLRASLTPGGPSVKIDSLFVDKISLLDYDYSGIAAAGTLSQDTFDGKIICNDPNLNFIFQGLLTPSAKTANALYQFYANIGYADLRALNLDKRGQVSRVSGQVNANYMRVKKADMIGDVSVTGLVLEDDSGRHDIGNIALRSHSNEDVNRINLQSSFADASYVGNRPLSQMIRDLQALTAIREIPALYKEEPLLDSCGRYAVNINMHDSRDLLSFVKKGFYIADSTRMKLTITPEGELSANLVSPRIALGNNYFRRMTFNADNSEGRLMGKLNSQEIRLGGMRFLDGEVSLFADDNAVGAGFTYDNKTPQRNQGEIYLTGNIGRNGDTLTVDSRLMPSNIYYEGDGWSLTGKQIKLTGKDISIDGLLAECNDQRVSLDGGYSSTRNDTLSLSLERFDIGILNNMTNLGLDLEGLVSGEAAISSPAETNPGILMHLTCDSTRVAGRPAGVITLSSTWDEETSRFHASSANDISGKKTFLADAYIDPADGGIDATLSLDGFDLGYAQPILKSLFSSMGGAISGEIKAKGKSGRFDISGTGTTFDSATVTVGFTGVPYLVDGPFHLDNEGLHFDQVCIRDRYEGRGEANGGILFHDFKGIELDTHIKMTDMECLDTDSGPSFYGNVFASGRADITGPLNALVLDIDAQTAKNGVFHVPISGSGRASRSDLLTFKEEAKFVYIDPYDLMMNRIYTQEKRAGDMTVRLKVRATPTVQAVLELGSDQENGLTGRGRGDISLLVRPARKEFSINGDYTLSEGNFHYNALGLASRNFSITDGSSIRFGGDIMQSILDMNANYTTKTSISTLIADTTSVSSRKTVNCGIGISGRLSNPQLKFSIDVPDLDPTTQARVESALNTDDKVQKQFLSLLISGGFMPDEQSGIVNTNSNLLFSNVAEIMASQLNTILEKLEIPIDFGLNYQESGGGNDIFDVAVSTQLFNNRVLVNGTLGNRRYTPTSGSDEMVGDIDVEIKLDRSGTLRLNLFSHSADDYTNYLDNLQRNGVGIAYQREFSNFKTFIRNLFRGRKRREADAVRAAEQPPKEKTIIYIDEDE